MTGREKQKAITPPGRVEARAIGALLFAGACLALLSVALPHPSGSNVSALILTALPMGAAGLLCRRFADHVPIAGTHVLIGAASFLAGLFTYESAVAAGIYGSIFVWVTMMAAYFFPKRVAAAHLAWTLAVYAVTLAIVPSTAGFSPLTRWLFTAFSLTLILFFVSYIVARRARADRRARSFFDLSEDMLCTANTDGYFVELNTAWQENLGYTPEELRSVPFIEHVHPEDRERTTAEAAALFDGAGAAGFENRYVARDGSLHWLRWSARLAPDEKLIYARATDVTELKLIEAEREELLGKVEEMARSDALTGLPNRRALSERLPGEMARARRLESGLCVAIVDIDHFKAYNDGHGHLAGDDLLCECAAAWDEALRGEDLLVRFGGEEFLVMLPGTEVEQAEKIVERLREATPGETTCSAGLALWDGVESDDELLARADSALYMAKAGGRDLLVLAPLETVSS